MLPHHLRLRHSTEIRTVFREGKRVKQKLCVLVVRPSQIGDTAPTRFCFVAGKKVGNAPRRNRAKRLLREAVRLHVENVGIGWDCIFLAHYNTSMAQFEDVERELIHSLKRAGIWQNSSESVGQ